MKHIITATFLFCTFHLLAQTNLKGIAAAATFGRYGTNCSTGRGACSFIAGTQNDRLSFAMSEKVGGNILKLTISRIAISMNDELRIAGKPFSEVTLPTFFVQEMALKIDTTIVRKLAIDTKYNTIAPAQYPMRIDQEKVEIDFVLTISE